MTVRVFHWPKDYPHGHAGHVAIEVAGSAGQTYLSWWPKGDPGFAGLVGVAGKPNSKAEDLIAKGMSDAPVVIDGLNEAAMIQFARETREYWSLFGTSCAQVAVDSLRRGGGDKYASGMVAWNTVWTPLDVKLYAEAIAARLKARR